MHLIDVSDKRNMLYVSQEVFDCMQRIPPIDPESLRPQGEWVDAEDGDGIVCPACGEDFCVLTNETERFRFCPNCGACMKGAGEDE